MSALKLILLSSIIFIIFAVVAPPIHVPTDDGSDWTSKHEAEMRMRCPPIQGKELRVGSIHRNTDSSNHRDRLNPR